MQLDVERVRHDLLADVSQMPRSLSTSIHMVVPWHVLKFVEGGEGGEGGKDGATKCGFVAVAV